MSKREFISHSESDTRGLGRKLGENVESGICVLLSGDLGAGKTALVTTSAYATCVVSCVVMFCVSCVVFRAVVKHRRSRKRDE